LPRLFTGLEAPAELAAELALLRGGLAGARWIEPEDYHITLRFIGDVDEAVAREAAEALAGIRRPPLIVALEGLGWFGADKPHAIIVKVKPDAPLVELQAEQERLLRRIGLDPSPRKYAPHITLARLRSASPHAVAAYLGGRGYFNGRQFEAKRFVLYSARQRTGGGPYLIEVAYDLSEPTGSWK
jgi:2'-5' RNA ligase